MFADPFGDQPSGWALAFVYVSCSIVKLCNFVTSVIKFGLYCGLVEEREEFETLEKGPACCIQQGKMQKTKPVGEAKESLSLCPAGSDS